MTNRQAEIPQRLSGVAALFDGSRLALARRYAGLRKADLAARIEMSPASISGWESGAKVPTAAALAKLALALDVEPQFFAQSTPSATAPGRPHFRSLRSTSQVEQDEAYAFGVLAGDFVSLLERSVDFPPVELPAIPTDRDTDTNTPENAAQVARAHFAVPDGPVSHVVRLAEKAGVVVVFSAPKTASIDAFSMEAGGRPLVVLNPVKDDYYRQRFDAAHELGHLIMHADVEPGSRVAEAEANRFAAEFLMPASDIRQWLPASTTQRGWQRLKQLKEHWGVSIQALLFRARALGVMSEVTYRNAMIRVSANGWRRDEPGDIRVVEMPSLIPGAAQVLEEAGIDVSGWADRRALPGGVIEVLCARQPRSVLPRS